MSELTRDLDSLVGRVEASEKARIRRTMLTALIPAVLGIGLLGFSAWRMYLAEKLVSEQRQLAAYHEEQAVMFAEESGRLRRELAEVQQDLQRALDLSAHRHPIDEIDVKRIFTVYPEPARLLRRAMRLRDEGTGWQLGGRSPETGFDSPGFAAYMLREFNLLDEVSPVGDDALSTSAMLYRILPATDSPTVGDLVFYPGGYVMFFFQHVDGRPFVVGMSPFGIVSLDVGFAQPTGYRKSGM